MLHRLRDRNRQGIPWDANFFFLSSDFSFGAEKRSRFSLSFFFLFAGEGMKFLDGGFLVKKWAGLAWRGNAVLCRPRSGREGTNPRKSAQKVCGGFWGREREGASRGQLRRFFGVPDFVMAGASLGSVRQSGSGDCGLGFLRPAGCAWASADGGPE